MKFKKTSIVGLALSLLLVCGVTVAFATEPVEPSLDSIPAVSEPTNITPDPTPVLTEEELLWAELQDIIANLDPEIKLELGYKLEYPVAQSNCTHPNLNTAPIHSWTWRNQGGEDGHEFWEYLYRICPDCGERIRCGEATLIETVPHSFGAGRYVSANHTAANPSNHYFTFNHSCSVCGYSSNYTVLAGCTKSSCVGFNSVSPEPELTNAVRTSDGTYALCGAKSCLVSYDHYHLDGKVVRVYYENPGLLCTRSSCGNEGPHTHDGVQFVDKAPEAYVILGPEREPEASVTPVTAVHH